MPNNIWTDKQKGSYVHSGILFSFDEEWNHSICQKTDVTGYVKWYIKDSEIQTLQYLFSYVESFEKSWKYKDC